MFKRTLLAGLILTSPAYATKTQFFKHADRAAFETGTLDNVVATNFGELRLSRALDPLMKDEGKYASIDAMAELPDGSVLVGTTASGKLLKLAEGKTTELADFGEAAGISTIAMTAGGDALIGISGEQAEVQILRKGAAKPERLAQLPEGVQYIWAVAIAADGKIYLGTGPNGQLFQVSADGKEQRVVYDSDEDNIRALAILNDTIFVGTDPNGLILKVDCTTGKAFVIYDAPETEVSSLLVDPRGGEIYAATSQLVEASAESDAKSANGSPAGQEGGGHMTFEPADAPTTDHGDAGDGTLGESKEAEPKPPAPQDAADEGPATRPADHAAISSAGPKPTTESDAAAGGEAAANGNAVYRIEPQGFVSEVFRDTVMIFGLARQNDDLFIATGPSGAVYQLNLVTEEHCVIAKVRPPQVTSICSLADHRLLLGTGGGSAEAFSLSGKVSTTGSFVSPVLDASRASTFGKLQVHGAVPTGATLTVSTRGSNVEDEASPLWSEWSTPVPAARFTDVQTPTARYAQYKLTFGGDGTTGPTVAGVEWAYLQPNVAPRVDSITVADAAITTDEKTGETSSTGHRTIEWGTTEPNGDELRYSVFARKEGRSLWTPIGKDITEASYDWDTHRVADGRYEVKVEASDALANPTGMGKTASRVAESVVVDNTPPVIGDIKTTRANGKVTITFRAADKGSIVSKMEYAVDEAKDWQAVPPSDMLNDSPDEQYTIVLPAVSATESVVSLRCADEYGNTAHESVTVIVPK